MRNAGQTARWSMMLGLLAAGLAVSPAAAVPAGQPGPGIDMLTPANLASLRNYPIARLAARDVVRATGQGAGVLEGSLLPVAQARLEGTHRCHAVYFSVGHVFSGDAKPCQFGHDADGITLAVPGLFSGHVAASEAQRLLFYGVRLSEGGGLVPRYGFSPSRDVAGFLYATGDGRLRLEIAAEPGRFEVIEMSAQPGG